MSSTPINTTVNTSAVAYQEVPESVDHLSSMPPEIVTRIHASLNRWEDNHALACSGREVRKKSNREAVRCMRFEDKPSATLQEIRELLARNPGFSSQQKLDLDLSGSNITDAELQDIVNRFPNINEINATRCRALTNNGLLHLTTLRNLTALSLRGCPLITDDGLPHLARLTTLITLSLADCPLITDKGLPHLAPLTNLATLSLRGCPQITDQGLPHLAPLTNLTDLSLTGCTQITDNGVHCLSRFLPSLAYLNLGGCRRITDLGLRHLVFLRNLANLSLKGCHEITDAGARYLGLLDNLIALNLADCPLITPTGHQYLEPCIFVNA